MTGRPHYKDYVPYYVSKASVAALTEALALQLAPEILVNAIAPGPILAPPDLTVDEDAEVLAATPLARWGGAQGNRPGLDVLYRDGFRYRRIYSGRWRSSSFLKICKD